ncbi:hypothetical protein GQ457_01G020810 [Hibiscus cannabinus]
MAHRDNAGNGVPNNQENLNNNDEAPPKNVVLVVNMEEERPIREHSSPNIDNLMLRLVGPKTGDKSRFLELNLKSGGVVTFDENSKGHIEGIGSIGNHYSILIDDFLLSIHDVSANRVLQIIHMNLFGPIRTMSMGGKSYAFVLVEDYSRYNWGSILKYQR